MVLLRIGVLHSLGLNKKIRVNRELNPLSIRSSGGVITVVVLCVCLLPLYLLSVNHCCPRVVLIESNQHDTLMVFIILCSKVMA